MKYCHLGDSNLKVSALCLDTMMFGDQTDHDEAATIVADAHAHGVNFIDSADVYSKGGSESMLGALLKAQRHDWVLATKLGNRMPEVEVLPACAHYGIGVAPYSPIARGVLTGKYLPGQAPAKGTRAGRADRRMGQTDFRAESLVIAQQLKVHAEARGISLAQFATAWVLANPVVSSVIAGPRTLKQWQDYRPALDYVLTPEDEALVDSVVKPGHPSTPGYTDPVYPINGRVRGHTAAG